MATATLPPTLTRAAAASDERNPQREGPSESASLRSQGDMPATRSDFNHLGRVLDPAAAGTSPRSSVGTAAMRSVATPDSGRDRLARTRSRSRSRPGRSPTTAIRCSICSPRPHGSASAWPPSRSPPGVTSFTVAGAALPGSTPPATARTPTTSGPPATMTRTSARCLARTSDTRLCCRRSAIRPDRLPEQPWPQPADTDRAGNRPGGPLRDAAPDGRIALLPRPARPPRREDSESIPVTQHRVGWVT